MTTRDDSATSNQVLDITCTTDVPLQTVFDAWTRSESMNWWAPREFTCVSAEMQPRPGGRWQVRMRDPDGGDHVESGAVVECVPAQRLVLTHAWNAADGSRGHETTITIGFEREDEKTRVTFRQGTFESTRARDLHGEGWISALGVLADHLGTHLSVGTLGRPGAAGELLSYARPFFHVVCAHLTAQQSREPSRSEPGHVAANSAKETR